jgi:hypothetical protein
MAREPYIITDEMLEEHKKHFSPFVWKLLKRALVNEIRGASNNIHYDKKLNTISGTYWKESRSGEDYFVIDVPPIDCYKETYKGWTGSRPATYIKREQYLGYGLEFFAKDVPR